jgi:3-oxoacyl-[acyl-carrier-protein] synthase III
MTEVSDHVITADRELYVAGTASWLPPAVSTEEEVRRGHCDPAVARTSEMVSVTVSHSGEVAAEMAVRAGREALARSGCPPERIGLSLHAGLVDQGHDIWAPASYVHHRTVGTDRAPSVEVRQASNGGMAALHLAAAYLGGVPRARSALLTTAARVEPPTCDRWAMDLGTVYGDGAAALVLSRAGGFARLLSSVLISGAELEGLHRPGPADGPAEMYFERPLDLTAYKKGFVTQRGIASVAGRIEAGQRDALDTALEAAEVTLEDIDWFVLPHFSRRRLRSTYLTPMAIDIDRTTWDWNRRVGHLGPGDQFAGLDHLARTGALRPGQRCLLMSVGAGFSWACAVLRVERSPGSDPGA